MDFIKKTKDLLKGNNLVIIILVVLVFCFFWYEIRPTIVYRSCSEKSNKEIAEMSSKIKNASMSEVNTVLNISYLRCIRSWGINK